MFFTIKEKQLKCLLIMNLACSISLNGGSSYLEKVKARIGKGIFPASANFSTDLHSLGQYIQEGRRDLFETVIKVDQARHELID